MLTLVAALVFGAVQTSTVPQITIGGYVEAFYQWNFNDPSNGITNFRGFDNRHNSFTISNAVIDAQGTYGAATAHLALQIGHTPETYYLAEPASPGAGGAGSTGPGVWKFLQQANAGYRIPIGEGLLAEAGIFLSPVGPEGIPVKDQWAWSRSNLFFGLPFYHAGLRFTYPVTDRLTLVLMGCNGWNDVVDNNGAKSVEVHGTYTIADTLVLNLLYFGGIERPTGAAEGKPWRHLFDAHFTWNILPELTVLLHGDAGFEPNNFGTQYWVAGAVAVRVKVLDWLYLAARGDVFHEGVPDGATAIFWPSDLVASQTATIDLRPVDHVSIRLEYRHDLAGDPMFFEGDVPVDMNGGFVANAKHQDTLTAGLTAWF